MFIKNGKLLIRNAEETDCEQIARWWNDGAVMAHAGFPNGLGTTADEVKRLVESNCDETGLRLVIAFDGLLIGEMSYSVKSERTAEIGIKICEFEFQNRGLGRVLLSMFIKELFKSGFTKIVLDTNLINLRAQHVYEMLGFEKKRVVMDCWKDQLGRLQSRVDYELTPERFIDLSVIRM